MPHRMHPQSQSMQQPANALPNRAPADDDSPLTRQVAREFIAQQGSPSASTLCVDQLRETPSQRQHPGQGGTRGDHDVHDAGAAGELTGTTREWRFGDEQPLDVVKTVSNAVRRRMVDRDGPLLRPVFFAAFCGLAIEKSAAGLRAHRQ